MDLKGATMTTNNAPPQAPPPLALRPRDAAAALGISERKLWEVTADRTSGIPHVKLGKAVLYPVDELRRWLSDKAGGNV
jgi:hypothetical protein